MMEEKQEVQKTEKKPKIKELVIDEAKFNRFAELSVIVATPNTKLRNDQLNKELEELKKEFAFLRKAELVAKETRTIHIGFNFKIVSGYGVPKNIEDILKNKYPKALKDWFE